MLLYTVSAGGFNFKICDCVWRHSHHPNGCCIELMLKLLEYICIIQMDAARPGLSSILFLPIDWHARTHLSLDFKISSEIYIVVCWSKVSLTGAMCRLFYDIFLWFSWTWWSLSTTYQSIVRMYEYDYLFACVCVWVSVISSFGINAQAPSLYG